MKTQTCEKKSKLTVKTIYRPIFSLTVEYDKCQRKIYEGPDGF